MVEIEMPKGGKERYLVIIPLIIALVALLVGVFTDISFNAKFTGDGYDAVIEYSTNHVDALVTDDRGLVEEEFKNDNIPTVEEVDGGKFEDASNSVSLQDGEYADLGWAETYNTSSPTSFRDATLGKCITAQNFWGAQCVSLARVFWWSYANRDVSTCGTGAAKGMMDCAEQNAGDDFEIHWKDDIGDIQAGDWIILTGGQYGHVGMALGHVHEGYVTLLGENQGGESCAEGGSATNIINISTKNIIGYYRPKAYIKKAPEPIKEEKIPEKAPETGVLTVIR